MFGYHLAAGDWQVQYQFCRDVISERKCTTNEDVAAVVRVNSSHWQPYLLTMNCHCQHNMYHVKGWMVNPDTDLWDYEYECHQVSLHLLRLACQIYKNNFSRVYISYCSNTYHLTNDYQ